MQEVDQKTHLLRRLLEHEFLCPGKLWDSSLSRNALPLSRAAPTGLSRRCRSRVDRAHDKAHRLPLRRRRRHEKTEKPSRKGKKSEGYLAIITCHYSRQRQRSTSESSQTRWTAHPPPAPGRPTPSDSPKDLQSKIRLRSNKDPKAISNQNTRQKKSDAHLNQYAPRAYLQAAEDYSDNFWD